MAVRTIDEKFEDWFQDVLFEAQDQPIPDIEVARDWAYAGFQACLKLIRDEGVESRMEEAMRELKLLSDTHPSAFRKVAERLEKIL